MCVMKNVIRTKKQKTNKLTLLHGKLKNPTSEKCPTEFPTWMEIHKTWAAQSLGRSERLTAKKALLAEEVWPRTARAEHLRWYHITRLLCELETVSTTMTNTPRNYKSLHALISPLTDGWGHLWLKRASHDKCNIDWPPDNNTLIHW